MALDGWTLNEKLDKLREQIESEMVELKVNFAALYDYIKRQEEDKTSSTGKKAKTTKD